MEEKSAPMALEVTSKLHELNVTVRNINAGSGKSVKQLFDGVLRGMPTNSVIHVICLLSEKTFKRRILKPTRAVWTHMVHSRWLVLDFMTWRAKYVLKQRPCTFYLVTRTEEGFEVLGPKSARRDRCIGVMTLSKWPAIDNKTSVVVRSPATEERSSELFLACSELMVDGKKKIASIKLTSLTKKEIEDKTAIGTRPNVQLKLIRPGELDGLRLILRYLNITNLRAAIAPFPFTSDKKFPNEGTLTGLLVYGKADMNFIHTVITEPRAFAADFVFPIRYEKFAYMFPSPRVYTSRFAALRIFSVPVWALLGASLLLLRALLCMLTYVHKWKSYSSFVVLALFLGQDIDPSLSRQQNTSIRLFLATTYFLCFMVSYSFTGGYISYLNLRGHGPVPDTTDKLFDMLRSGRIEPCLGKNTFINVSLANPSSHMVKRLHDTVADWSPFILTSMHECARRTVERRAVLFSSFQNLERYVYSHKGHVQISSEYIQDYTPMGYVLPRASPYKEVMHSVLLRMFEAGLFDQFERLERYRSLPGPQSSPDDTHETTLRLSKSLLPFFCLAAGLVAGFAAFSLELLTHKLKSTTRKKKPRRFPRRHDVPSWASPRKRALKRNLMFKQQL